MREICFDVVAAGTEPVTGHTGSTPLAPQFLQYVTLTFELLKENSHVSLDTQAIQTLG